MKNLILLAMVLVMQFTAMGQQQRNRGRAMERIHAAKIAYIADRLHLTTDQSAPFVVIYNEYEAELIKYRREVLGKYKGMNPEDADNETARQFVEDDLDYQQKVIDLKRHYNDKFLKVITSQQLAELAKAEREFRMLLLDRLKKRRDGKANMGNDSRR